MKTTFELFSSVPWGDKDYEISLTLEDYPNYAFVLPEEMRKVRAPVRIRLGAHDGLDVLPSGPLPTSGGRPVFMLHFDAEGKMLGKTPLPCGDSVVEGKLIITDYAVDEDYSCWLLEIVRSGESGQLHNRLQKVSKDGALQWSREGPISSEELDFHQLKGTFTQLLMDGHSRLYLAATEQAGAIAEINTTTGDVKGVNTPEKFGGNVFMTEQRTVHFVRYFPDLNRRGLGAFNLADQSFRSFVGDEPMHGWLNYPFGVDASSNFYAWNESAVARISFDGQITMVAELNNVFVRSSDHAIYSSRLRADDKRLAAVQVDRYLPGAGYSRLDLRLPDELTGTHWFKMIHVDEQDQYYVYGEQRGRFGTLLVYDGAGNLREKLSPPPDLLPLESRLENYSFWQVDSSGRIYLPVTDAHGFKVVRLTGD